MKLYPILALILLVAVQASAQCPAKKSEKQKETGKTVVSANEFKDLPEGVKLDSKVRENVVDENGIILSSETITVEEKLRRLGAGYVDGVLVDKDGTEIRFYSPVFRGASEGPQGDREYYKSEAKRLADMKKKYTVIEIFVDPRGIM